MPDPNVLYVVTAIVVFGLVVWVGIVLLSPGKNDARPAAEGKLPQEPTAAVDVGRKDGPTGTTGAPN
jgi:hypothetical protein